MLYNTIWGMGWVEKELDSCGDTTRNPKTHLVSWWGAEDSFNIH